MAEDRRPPLRLGFGPITFGERLREIARVQLDPAAVVDAFRAAYKGDQGMTNRERATTMHPALGAPYAARSDVPAALADNLRTHLPYSFRGQRCSLHQLRVVLADACQWDGQMPRMLMDDRGIYLKPEEPRRNGRLVKFTRTIDAEGVSVINPDWIEE